MVVVVVVAKEQYNILMITPSLSSFSSPANTSKIDLESQIGLLKYAYEAQWTSLDEVQMSELERMAEVRIL